MFTLLTIYIFFPCGPQGPPFPAHALPHPAPTQVLESGAASLLATSESP